MSKMNLIFLMCFAAFLLQPSMGKRRPKGSDEDLNHNWIWGHTTKPTTRQTPTTAKTIKTPAPYDPCSPFNPPVPDFRAPGRTISEAKCYEYVWQLKNRVDQEKRKRACEISRLDSIPHIFGGRRSLQGEYPHMGALGWKAVNGTWKFLCGSALISSKFVLTAAHCASSPRDTTLADPAPKIVRLGAKHIQHYEVDANISKIIVYPKYKAPLQYYDIALIELEKPVEFSRDLHPACLWSKSHYIRDGQTAEISGWGVTEKGGGQQTSSLLLAGTVNIVEASKCDSLLKMWRNRKWRGLQDHQICAGKAEGGVDTCQGDSGGPLSVKISLPIKNQGEMYYVIGVTSFGIGCALPGLPGVYTRVSSFVGWIESIVWPGL